MTKKIGTHAVLSTILLLPVSIILENSDGIETVNSISGGLQEWIAPVIISMIISAIIRGIKKILRKESSFWNIYYHTAYSIAIMTLLAMTLKYL